MASTRLDLGAATWRRSSYSNGSGGDCLEVAEGFATWRKSSYSNTSGGDCLEVAEGFATWRKSSHSNSSGGDCLEVADGHQGLVPVRDSKRPEGPALVVHASAWSPFVESVKAS
ncbi:DUF397 domain-containing protein [Streptomyces sp. NBC_01237]|uniref:DUF397 domain-containing protein n=1 Tax=Streptomyces sp. NBC_01237 TaxID=2903790 RepID=UPI002DD83837|nr:DUF397 domain-containing protein [Streptomyces sp. NBC_01237]WRZ73030.1 DUF397 domain-containing protein [Streptomyces sp. NBC_01237]